MVLIGKKGLFWTFFPHFLFTRKKTQKIPSAQNSLTKLHVFAQPIDIFELPIFAKKYKFIIWFLLVRLLVLILTYAE